MARDKKVFANFYRDSVSLMQISAALSARPGIAQASAVMASEANLDLLSQAGLLDAGGAYAASDLLIAVEGDTDALAAALEEAEALLTRETAARSGGVAELAHRARSKCRCAGNRLQIWR